MKNYIKPPRLSTSFSKNGMRVKNRFSNILDMRGKKRGVIAMALVISTAFMFGGCFAKEKSAAPAAEEKKDESINVAVIGVDASGERNDLILLCGMDDTRVKVTQIPRDTYLSAGEKIGLASSPEKVIDGIAEVTGVRCEKYVSVNFSGAREIVDEIGGIDIEIPTDMHYTDPYQGLEIDLEAGTRHLNGEQLEMLMRYRNGNVNESGAFEGYKGGDLGRLAVQRSVYETAAKKLLKSGLTAKLPAIIAKNTQTNLSVSDIAKICLRVLTLDAENVSIDVLPGEYNDNGQYIPLYTPDTFSAAWIGQDENAYFLNAREGDIDFVTQVKSARVDGVDYNVTKAESKRDVFYRDGAFFTYYKGYIDENRELQICPMLKSDGSLAGSVMILDKTKTLANEQIDISSLTVDGGEFTLSGVDSDTEIIIELTKTDGTKSERSDLSALYGAEDTLKYGAKITSARVNGADYDITEPRSGYMTMYNERLNTAFIQCSGDYGNKNALYVQGMIFGGEGELSISERAHEGTERLPPVSDEINVAASVSKFPKEGGELTLSGVDSDTRIVVELTGIEE